MAGFVFWRIFLRGLALRATDDSGPGVAPGDEDLLVDGFVKWGRAGGDMLGAPDGEGQQDPVFVEVRSGMAKYFCAESSEVEPSIGGQG
jgi:hypothetical protein